MAIHDFIDSSKMAMPDMRHRAALHNAFGCYIVERVFGHTIRNSDGREVSTRDVAENHIIEDLGFLPSLEDFLDELPMSVWHGGIHRLPKDQRPPTPAEAREAARNRVRACLWGKDITNAAKIPSLESDAMIDDIIRAVTGASAHQEND